MALDFAAGCLGGCAGLMVGYPLDTIKVHIQTQDHRNPRFKGTWHCFRTILARESISGLYRGMTSPMAGVAVVNAIVFGVYGQAQRSLVDNDHLLTHFLAGASAGLAQSPVCSPLELAKTRLQLQSRDGASFSGPIQCLRHVYRHEGRRGVFNGLGITALREAPSFGVYFLTYEALTRTTKMADITTFHMLMAGGLAGTASWIVTYPVDVIKSRLQADGTGRYSGAIDCLRQSVQTEGYKWLFRGLNSTILRAFPTNAATFAVVTWTFRIFGHDNIDDSVEVKSTETPADAGKELTMSASITGTKKIEENRRQSSQVSFVDKCNTLVSRVMDDYSYESRSYYSANVMTMFVDEQTTRRIVKSDNDVKQRRIEKDAEDFSCEDQLEDVSGIEDIHDSTSENNRKDEDG